MSETEIGLPATVIKRIVKAKLAEQFPSDDGKPKDINLSKEALLAFGESAKVFINYITAMSNDICKENKRQTISAEDVFKALSEIDFDELVEPLKEALQAFRASTKEKNQKRSEAKKRKAEEESGKDKQQGSDQDKQQEQQEQQEQQDKEQQGAAEEEQQGKEDAAGSEAGEDAMEEDVAQDDGPDV